MARTAAVPSRSRLASANAAPTTPSPSPIGPSSILPSPRRNLTNSSTPSAPGTKTPTTRRASAAPSPTASPQRSPSVQGWTTVIGWVAPEAPVAAAAETTRPGETTTMSKATDHPAPFNRKNGWSTLFLEAPVHRPVGAASSCTTAMSTRCSGTRLSPFIGRRSRSPSTDVTTGYTYPGRVLTPLW